MCTGGRRGTYMVLAGRCEGKKPLDIPMRRWTDNIKMDLQKVEWVGKKWLDLAQGRDR